MSSPFESQLEKIESANGFVAALDQSGGSSPKALQQYGIPDEDYVEGETSMFDAIHGMRQRIMTSPSFNGDRILGAILFEDTMAREVMGKPTATYLWEEKDIVPFLKVDQGLDEETLGVQLMKNMTKLDDLLHRAKKQNIFGTKMRSVIKLANKKGIDAIVDQQFEIGRKIIAAGLVPILEPEVDIHSKEKAEAEELLKSALLNHLDELDPDQKVMLKLSLPSTDNFYRECIHHPNVIRVVALSGGYSREHANTLLSRNEGLVGSFSRALTEGLSAHDTAEEFDNKLDDAVASIYFASVGKM